MFLADYYCGCGVGSGGVVYRWIGTDVVLDAAVGEVEVGDVDSIGVDVVVSDVAIIAQLAELVIDGDAMGCEQNQYSVIRGTTGPEWRVSLKDVPVLTDDYRCRVGISGVVDRYVQAVDGDASIHVQLTPDETAALTPGEMYKVALRMENPQSSPPLVVETAVFISVSDSVFQ